MIVTEGEKAYRQGTRALVLAVAIFLLWLVLFCLVPVLIVPAIWVCFVMSATTIGRYVLLSVVSRFDRRSTDPPVEAPVRTPSIAFIIPCLNELPSLRNTVPAMTSLTSDADVFFLYVCESASTDGTPAYLAEQAERDGRIMLLVKAGPPAGRGSAVKYGIAHLQPCDLVGFLDADYMMDQTSFDRLLAVMGHEDSPAVLQGASEAANETSGVLPRLLSLERRWMDLMELKVNPKLGGMCYIAAGQGFFQRRILDDPRFVIDESSLVDDIDLSCELALGGQKVVYDPGVVSRCMEVTSPGGYLAQRRRWMRGWVQVSRKYLGRSLRVPGLPGMLRYDLVRFLLKPYRLALLFVTLPAFIALFTVGNVDTTTLVLFIWVVAALPVAGVLPVVAGACRPRPKEILLSLVGVPALLLIYLGFFAVAVLEEHVLRTVPHYSKTEKADWDRFASPAHAEDQEKPEDASIEGHS